MSLEYVRKADFFPLGPLHDRRNYKRCFYVQKDGSVLERVHLEVTDQSHREHLICCHYLLHLTRNFLQHGVGVNVIGRDAPWDFSLNLSSGETFFLEITSIADSQRLYEINKREERFAQWADHKHIPLHELKKLAVLFPDCDLEEAARHERQGRNPSDLVPNPFFKRGTRLFLSNMPEPARTLSQLIQSAIKKKSNYSPHNQTCGLNF